MIQRGQRCSVPSAEVCGYCGSRRSPKYAQGDGDQGYQWKCAGCRVPTADNCDPNTSLLTVMGALSDKFEVVNKIQLPKLNGALTHIKQVSETIAKQNSEILRKLSEAEKLSKKSTEVHSYRKRNVHLPNLGQWNHKRMKTSTKFECNCCLSMLPPERTLRYRVRRKSYSFILSKMVQALNRRLNCNKKSPRMRRR